MTELCKFCATFRRLYIIIDNIIKASKIKIKNQINGGLVTCIQIFLKNAEEDRNRLIHFSKPRGIIVKDALVCIGLGACPYILKKMKKKIDRFKRMLIDI